MGRRRQAALVLNRLVLNRFVLNWLILSLTVVGLAMAGTASPPPLRAARWLPAARWPQALAFEPSECLHLATDPALARRIAIGRTAFRTPLLLGGQAARAGLACNSCHRSGRGNPDFQFPGLSGAPGTADVTSSLMSSHRGDGIDNPKSIPDLSGPRDRLKISRDPADRKLEDFIHGLVTQEFDGPEPGRTTLDGLAAYVRALDPTACPAIAERPIRLANELADVRAALDAAGYALDAHDRGSVRLMLASARSTLGLIDERYADPRLAGDRRRLRDADLGLAAIQDAVDRGSGDVALRIAAWLVQMPMWTDSLARDESSSLFGPATLAAGLANAPASGHARSRP